MIDRRTQTGHLSPFCICVFEARHIWATVDGQTSLQVVSLLGAQSFTGHLYLYICNFLYFCIYIYIYLLGQTGSCDRTPGLQADCLLKPHLDIFGVQTMSNLAIELA